MASLAAKGVEVDRNAMTAEEREMFVDLLEAIETNHDRVVGKVQEPFQTSLSAGDPTDSTETADASTDDPTDTTEAADASTDDPTDTTEAADASTDGVAGSAADDDAAARAPGAEVAGDGRDAPEGRDDPSRGGDATDDGSDRPPGEAAAADPAPGSDAGAAGSRADGAGAEAATTDAGTDAGTDLGDGAGRRAGEDEPSSADVGDGDPPDGFVRVRVVEEIPGFVGTDGVEYDPDPEDVVTIPEENAEALYGRDAAEPLDDAGSG